MRSVARIWNLRKAGAGYGLSSNIDTLLAVFLTAALAIFLLRHNVYATHDGFTHVSWGYYWSQQFLGGQTVPRWFEDAFGGLGSASFIFYPPLSRLLGLPFAILGLLPGQQLKGAFLIVLLLNAVGVVALSRLLLARNSLSAVTAICLGIGNPYLIVGMLQRGAAGEVTSIALVPWLMMGFHVAISSEKPWRFVPFTVALTALFFAHVPSSLIFVSCVLVSTGIGIVVCRRSWRDAVVLLVPLLLAALLSACIVLPILLDVRLIGGVGSPPYDERFLLNGVSALRVSLASGGFEKALSRTFVLDGMIVVFAILLARPWGRRDPKEVVLGQQILMACFGLFMMTDLSRPLYEAVSVFKDLKFPWRFLMVTASVSPYVLGYVVEVLGKRYPVSRSIGVALLLPPALLLIVYKCGGLSLARVDYAGLGVVDRLIVNRASISADLLRRIDHVDLGDGYRLHVGGRRYFYLDRMQRFLQPDVLEYLPATVPIRRWLGSREYGLAARVPPHLFERFDFVAGQGRAVSLEWRPGYRRLKVDAATAVIVNLGTFYYPGWTVVVTPYPGGQPQSGVLSAADDGRMQLRLPQGTYEVVIRYGGTLAERAGLWVSLCSILLVAFTTKIISVWVNRPVRREGA